MMRFLVWLSLVFCLLQAGLAMAQQAEPLMGSEATPAPALAPTAEPVQNVAPGFGGEDGVYRILVVGDALAGGLGNGMMRMIEGDPTFEVLNRFNESSGLARPEFYDWSAAIPKIVENAPVDAVVVLVGVNDRQGIRDGNIRHVFKAPGWEKAYIAAVDRVLASAKQVNAKVFWISLPPMASASFDADMRYLSDLHRQRVAAVQGNFVDVRPFFLGPDGSFIDRGPDDLGNDRKLRERDGIKFMKVGNNRFGQLVLGAVKALEANAVAPAVAVAPADPAATAVVAATPPKLESIITVVPVPPSFGQEDFDGEDLTFRADVVQPIVKPPVSVAARTAAETPAVAAAAFKVQCEIGHTGATIVCRGHNISRTSRAV